MEQLEIKIPVVTYKKEVYWIAYTPVLKTFGYSNVSEEEALKDFDRAIKTFFDVHEVLGTLEESLQHLGWTRKNHTKVMPKYFNKPMSFLPKGEKSERQIKIPA